MEEENNLDGKENPNTKSPANYKGIIFIGVTAIILIIVIYGVVISFNSNNESPTVDINNRNVEPSNSNSDHSETKETCREVQTPYEEQEEYLKKEYYIENIPYEAEIDLKYDSEKSNTYNCGSLFDYFSCVDIGIKNIDTIGGTFKIKCKFRTLNDVFIDIREDYVKPGDVVPITCGVNLDRGEDVEITYEVFPPTKIEIKYKDVQRERQVTAYRLVTKYKTEEVCD